MIPNTINGLLLLHEVRRSAAAPAGSVHSRNHILQAPPPLCSFDKPCVDSVSCTLPLCRCFGGIVRGVKPTE